jgi:oligoendopeptidase F
LAFDYESLPRMFPRRFVPNDLKFEWEDLSKVFGELARRDIGSKEALEKWMLDEAELDSVIYEQRSIRYINNSRQTDNPAYRKAYESYVTELEPKIKVAEFELLKKYVASPARQSLPREVYGLEDRRREAAVSIFRQENVDLERQDSLLAQEYQRTMGAMTVTFRGEERTLQQMSKFQEDPDRMTREEAWRLSDERVAREAERLDKLYGEMVWLRHRIAQNAGFDNYRDYVFVKKDRFDYTPEDCMAFHEAVEEFFVPLSREIDEDRMEKMGVDVLRPWDLRVDPKGRPPLSPFSDSDSLIEGCSEAIAHMDTQLSEYFVVMKKLQLLDLESRKGKAPGGYQEELTEVKLPFIFMNAAKRDGDMRTLFHESGHSFHTFLIREAELPYFNGGNNVPMEFAEVASMSMEMISGDFIEGSFYDEAGARRSNREELESIVKLFTWVATIDAFQQWVYTHPEHSTEERAEAWVKTYGRFSGLESFEGLERSLRYRWLRQLHLFEVPFYYIEYGIASLGAVGIWLRFRKDRKSALDGYKRALSLGATKPLPELFEAAGLKWDLGPDALSHLASELRAAIKQYSD